MMLGAIAGDIIGSYYESHPTKNPNFELLRKESRPTDDTVMTLAVAEWLIEDKKHTHESLSQYMRKWGRKFPNAGYGGMFHMWLNNEQAPPYGSYGNGAAMRVSPVALYASSLEEALKLAKISAEVTHNHPEGIKGAQAVAAAIWLAKNGERKEKIRHHIEEHFGYNLKESIAEIRESYSFDVTSAGSVPQAIIAYLEGSNFEEIIRLAISLGGDADTQAAIAGSIAAATPDAEYQIPGNIKQHCLSLMPPRMINGMYSFIHFLKHPTIDAPIRNSYKVDERIYAGEYPATSNEALGRKELARFTNFGITHFIDLTESGELSPYFQWLPKNCTYIRHSIKDCSTPSSLHEVTELLESITDIIKKDKSAKIYIHCRGGIGRTGTIVGCYYAMLLKSYALADNILQKQFSECPKSAYRKTPETLEQRQFIMRYADFVIKKQINYLK